MVDEGYISREQYQAAVAEPLAVKPRVLATQRQSYAMEAIRQQVIAQVGLDRAISQGLKIYTTIDARLQKTAEDSLRDQLDEIERRPAFQNHQTYAQYSALFHDEERRVAAAAQDTASAPTNVHSALPAPEYLQGALLMVNNAGWRHPGHGWRTRFQAQRVQPRDPFPGPPPGRHGVYAVRLRCRLPEGRFPRRGCFWIR